jgi:hypothetical protein
MKKKINNNEAIELMNANNHFFLSLGYFSSNISFWYSKSLRMTFLLDYDAYPAMTN